MALDVREVAPEQLSDALLRLPWGAVLTPQGFDVPDDVPHVRLDGPSALCKSGDVVELNPLQRKVAIRYRRGDTGNVLFATERCNSYCLMCSQPPREVEDDWRVHHLLDLIDLIDVAEPSLAISGGEPTLLGSGLVDIPVCGPPSESELGGTALWGPLRPSRLRRAKRRCVLPDTTRPVRTGCSAPTGGNPRRSGSAYRRATGAACPLHLAKPAIRRACRTHGH
ncbi:hypothetical protein G6F31_016315 [Rhizopus arrhizus]|nr:hypothetical protein G6F31_016315 [Rhizopus arrhizus]